MGDYLHFYKFTVMQHLHNESPTYRFLNTPLLQKSKNFSLKILMVGAPLFSTY